MGMKISENFKLIALLFLELLKKIWQGGAE